MGAESRSVVVRLSLDTAQAIRDSKQFGDEFGRAMDKAQTHSDRTSASIDKIGSTAGKTALVAGAALTAIVATTANFDEAMSHVAATGDDARQSIDQLREAAIQAGQSTAFSASEAAAGVENLAKAGVSAKDILGGGLKGSLDLAAAGGLEVADAAEVAATALTQFKLSGADVPHVADLLAAAAGKAQGDVSDMSFALKQSGLVASQMNISIEETTGTLAAFASAGLLGSDAGTSFRTMLLRLANPTKKSADAMKDLGIQAYDAQGQFVGMEAIAGQLQTALQNKTQAERDSALATIFGSDAIRAASVLYDEGASGIADWTSKVDDSGYAAKTAGTRMDNLKGDVEQLKGALETAFIGSGEGSQGALRKLAQGATAAVNAFNGLPQQAQSSATALLAITTVTSGGLWFGSKVIRGVAETRDALSNLGLTADRTQGSLGRMTRTAAGVTALAAAVGILGNELAAATGAKINGSDLSRDLEALANGADSKLLDQVVDSLGRLHDTTFTLSEPLHEAGTAFGLFGNTPLDNAADNIDQVDQALASLVESGRADEASAAFAKIAAAITGLPEGSSFSPSFVDGFDSYATALTNASSATDGAADATGDFGTASRQAAEAAKAEAAAVQASTKAMQDKRAATLGAFDAETQYRQALKDAREQAEKTNAGIRGSSDAALANRDALSGLASAWNGQSDAVKNNVGKFREARKAFVDTAAAMGVPREAARQLARQLLEIPKSTVTHVGVDTGAANRNLNVLYARLAEASGKHVTTYIDVITRSFNAKREGIARAGGGPIVGAGSKTSDSVPVLASNGEFMMSAAAVDHYGVDTMFRMNARRLAGGGDVSGRTATFDSTGTGVPVGPGVRGAMEALVAMNGIVKNLNGALHDAEKAVRVETRNRDRLSNKLDTEQKKLDEIQAQFDGLASTISQGLTSDAFAGLTSKNPWQSAGGIDSVISALTGDTANATAFDTARSQLSGSLSDGALQAVLEQGLGAAQTFAGATPEQLAAYQAAFDARSTKVGEVAAGGAGSVFGAARDAQAVARDEAAFELKQSNVHLSDLAKAARDADKRAEKAEHQRDEIRAELQERRGDAKDHAAEQKKQAEKNRGAAQGGQRDRRYARG